VSSAGTGSPSQTVGSEYRSNSLHAGEDYLEYMSEGAFEYGLGHLVNSLRAELEALTKHQETCAQGE
jgi:hypothetical protein